MKTIITLALGFYSVASMAQVAGKPFQLEPGKYSFECWSVVVKSVESKLDHAIDYSKGTTSIVKQGDMVIETSQELSGELKTNSVLKTVTSQLSLGTFKQVTEAKSTYVYPADKPETVEAKWEVIIESANLANPANDPSDQFGHDRNVTVKNDGEQEKPGFAEHVWQKMADGRIVVQSYLREKMSSEKTQDGKSVDRLVTNSTCIYKKSK